MRALAEGNSLQSLSACRALDCLCSGSRHAWHGGRDNGPGVNHRSTAQLWGATRLVRPARPVSDQHHCVAFLSTLLRDATVIRVRHMGHEIFDRFILNGLPGPGDRKDKAPAACGIGLVTGFDHVHIGLGTLGSITAYDDQLRPTRGDTRAHHLAKQGMFAAIIGVAFGQDEPKAHRHTIPVPRGHQQHKAQAKKPGMMLAYTPFLHHRILGAAFVGVTAVAKQREDAIGGRRQGDQEILREPADEQMHVPIGRFQPASKAPGGESGGRPLGHLFQGWLLLDSRVVDLLMAYNPTFARLSSVKP